MALTQISTKGIKDGTITNADIGASAAIAGTKIDAAFGSQDLTVGGTASVPTDGLQLSFSAPEGHIKSKNSSGAPASNLAFHTTDTSGNTNRVMHLRHDGNVGIGTSSPSELLQVAGTLECNNIKFLTVNKFETSANVLEGKGTNGARLRSALSSATTPSFSSSDDTDSGMFLPGSNVLGLTTGGTERLRIDSAGTLLVAHSSQRNNFNSAASTEHAPIIQLEGVNQNRALSITAASNNDGGILMLARQNGSVGSNTVVSSGNQIGRVDFQASGGTNMELAAQISAEVDGTPGDNDMPGRLLFKTTADGANSSTERMRIDSSGNIGIGTTSPLSGAKLTVASLGLAITGQNLAHSANSLRLGEEGSGLAQFRAYGPNTSTAGSFQFTTSKSNGLAGADNAMRIDSSGNIGIGTDNPNGESINGSQNLVIMDTTSDGGMNIKTGTSGNAQIHFSDTSANGQGRLVYAHATDTLRLYAGGNDQFAIQSGIIDIFENRHIYQRFTTAISDGGSRTFTITGLGYGWAKIQIGGYGEGHYLGVEITVAGLMAGGGTYYDNQSQMNVSSGSASVSFNENQTSFVVTLNNNVGNGGSIHCTAVFTGAGNSAHPNCAVS